MFAQVKVYGGNWPRAEGDRRFCLVLSEVPKMSETVISVFVGIAVTRCSRRGQKSACKSTR